MTDISVVSSTISNQASANTVFSWTHDADPGLNEDCIFVSISMQNEFNITSLTYAGSAMTFVANQISTNRTQIWRILAPSTGDQTVSVTFDATESNIRFQSVGLYNVDQTTPVRAGSVATTGDNGVATLIAVTASSVDDLIMGVCARSGGGTYTNVADDQETILDNNSSNPDVIMSRMPGAVSGDTLRWSNTSGSQPWGTVGWSVQSEGLPPLVSDGDITAVVNADGFSIDLTIEGSSGGDDWGSKVGSVTYANQADRYIFGTVDAGTGNLILNLTSQGYSGGVLGTIARVVQGTKSVRKPYSGGGDEDDIDETTASDNLTVRIALSEAIYDDDTSVTITVASGFVVDGGDSSNAAVAVPVTNNSTLDYPKVIGQWDWDNLKGGWRREQSDFTVGFRARHGHGIDQVRLIAIGATSAVNTNADVASSSKTQNSNTSLYHESYLMGVTIADYTQAEQINLRAIAYPLVGDVDSLLDTNTVTATADRIRGLTTLFMMCDKTGAMEVFATVDPDDGNDGTGATNSTLAGADATPYLTIGAALTDGANSIAVLDSTAVPDILGSAVSDQVFGFYAEIYTHPDASGTVTLDRTGSDVDYNSDYLCFRDITISFSTGNGWLDGDNATQQVLFHNVTFANSATPAVGLGYKSQGCWFVSCGGIGTDDYSSFSTSRVAYSFTGCTMTGTFNCDSWYTSVANTSTTVERVTHQHKDGNNPGPVQNNVMLEHNQHYGLTANGTPNTWIRIGTGDNLVGVSVIANIIEVDTITGSGPIAWIGGDGSTVTLDHVIMAHNTFAGERCNIFYNDSGSSAVLRTNIFVYGNAFRSYNIKSDTFASSPNANRVGNWAQMWGVNYHDNIHDGSAAAAFTGEFVGLRSSYELAGGIATFGELGYVDEQSADLGTGGGGDYTPDTGSVLLDASIPSADDFVGFDSFGTVNSNNEIGAVFILATGATNVANNFTKIILGIGI